ncbi:hypothetical protein K9L05_02430 [Candidatus Babeliales bacterium]|nr:hypothetical protein [Candidatus Babeliales bacterium]MCF7899482.1 hypothetical protein [Candidatus Babeliales bacterium]
MGKIQKILFLVLLFFSSNTIVFADKKEFQEKKFETFREIITNLPEGIFKFCILEKYNNDLKTLCCLIQGLLLCHEPKYQSFVFSALEKIISFDKDINPNSQTTFYDILNAATQCLLESKRSFQWKCFWRLWPREFSQIYDKNLCLKRENHKCLFCNILKMRELCDKKCEIQNSNFESLNSVFLEALRKKRFDLARIILLHGFNIKAKFDLGYTLLYFMMTEKNFEAVKFLLKNGAVEEIEQNDDNKCKINSLLCSLDKPVLYKLFKGKCL